jgi:multidrug efflux pump subunit AcrA (membrane-fusion protein)
MKKPMKTLRTTVATIVILAIASMGVWAAWRAWPAHSSDLVPLTMKVEAGDWTINITASGELQAAESIAVAVPNVPVNGLRLASAVPDGRRVNKGDVLVEFDPAELNLQALDHRSSLAMANQKITQGEIGNELDKADLLKDKKLAELDLQKINEFLPRDAMIYSRREIVEGELDKSYTEQKIVFADARLETKEKIYSLDEAILLLERKQAENKISQVEKGLASVKLLAPRAGIVVYNNPGYYVNGSMLTPGRVLWSGLTLLNLVNPDQMEARCYVLEKDAGELRAGEQVTVTLDPYPGVRFSGLIKNIDRLARPLDSDSPVKYFQTVIALDKTDTKLMKPGVKVKAAISALLLKSAIVVPRSAIAKNDSGYIIFVQRAADRFEAVPVKLGRGDLIRVEIVEGIRPGQVIALNPPDMKQD